MNHRTLRQCRIDHFQSTAKVVSGSPCIEIGPDLRIDQPGMGSQRTIDPSLWDARRQVLEGHRHDPQGPLASEAHQG